ncbi:uncharacterized protein [Centroberyx affinis]|uniref:uncharacterized protein n=1 Tax=Centroberyx affinis TaxID=166261 RepID=UPI003A5BA42E
MRIRDLIADYYSNFRMRVSSGAVTSGWHKIEIGIITGCTISVILFSLAMNILTNQESGGGILDLLQPGEGGASNSCIQEGEVQEEVRAAVEEERSCRMVAMRQQGAWTRWENTIERKVTWAELWKAEPHQIKFLIQAVYDVLPSPSNLHTWAKVETPACPLCCKHGTLEHILSCCTKALGEGRYQWRHDQVLKVIAEAMSAGVEWAKWSRPSKHAIAFIRGGEHPKPSAKTSAGILASARDWQLLVDLERQGQATEFPQPPTSTLRPDIVLLSESTKQAVLLELTVPWEDCLEEAFERKLAKYEGLVSSCQQAGWRARCLPIEVGCGGFAARSLSRAFSFLGIEGARRIRAILSTTEAAERASRWLWLKRGEPWGQSS